MVPLYGGNMKFTNPIIKGFYPDPSVCAANGKYYLVTSTMQYFPGVPVFESDNLVNWKQVGNCLTRKNQVELESVESSAGVFAPTIRFHNGRFYMTTTNSATRQHFIVYTDDIRGEWSDPIVIDQDGIDPSLLFHDDKVYFMSNGMDDFGKDGVIQSEIDIATGKKLTKTTCIWQGTGGRFLEAPHLYFINDYYYLVAAEGGTEYGHMVTYARSKSPYGPFEDYSKNPVLTNRNLGGFEIQGVGHGDLVQAPNGDWFLLHLGFRQIGQWATFHHLGREVFMTPIFFGEDGWFTAGTDGTTRHTYDICGDFEQIEKKVYTFENTDKSLEWLGIRHPETSNYTIGAHSITLKGTDISLDMPKSPTFLGIRQIDFEAKICCDVEISGGEGGMTIYMDEKHHFDIALRKTDSGFEAFAQLKVGSINHTTKSIAIPNNHAKLIITADHYNYQFYINEISDETHLGWGESKYLSTEIAGGFTGVLIGLYAVDKTHSSTATFTNFSCTYR